MVHGRIHKNFIKSNFGHCKNIIQWPDCLNVSRKNFWSNAIIVWKCIIEKFCTMAFVLLLRDGKEDNTVKVCTFKTLYPYQWLQQVVERAKQVKWSVYAITNLNLIIEKCSKWHPIQQKTCILSRKNEFSRFLIYSIFGIYMAIQYD